LITSEQIRAARALLRITVAELSNSAGIGLATIKRLEAAKGLPPAHARTLDALRKTFEGAGIEFIGTPEDAPGVRLRLVASADTSQFKTSPTSKA
jgi:transcriptional regulator with XRE-family HTH domain